LNEVVDVAPGPEARYELRESIQLAFIAAIQQLPARQRAVLLLRDVLGWSAIETAQLLETTVASVNSALQRARATLERDASATGPGTSPPTDAAQHELLERYIPSWELSDMDAFAALLKEDAVLRMPPWIQWFRGRDAIRTFFLSIHQPRPAGGSRVMFVAANGQPAFAHYTLSEDGSGFRPQAIQVLTLERDAIAVLTAFLDKDLFPRFGLPLTLSRAAD
jgi:RNA polymerase sigma-70 factor (ECF subfamily)